jgi:hypothetical protein
MTLATMGRNNASVRIGENLNQIFSVYSKLRIRMKMGLTQGSKRENF